MIQVEHLADSHREISVGESKPIFASAQLMLALLRPGGEGTAAACCVGRDALMALYSGYGDSTILHSGDALVVHRSQEPGVLILEYEVHGKKLRTGKAYDNRFISVVTIKDRKIVHWRDYMDSLAAFTAETGAGA
jgi:hypothetical protein